jgi:hypothetical protein
MVIFGSMVLLWLAHAGIAAVLSAPIVYFGRKRVHWRPWELLALLLPFAIWTLLMFSKLSTSKKSLANLAEPFYFALSIPLATMVRVAIGSRISERACAACILTTLCVVAALMFFFVPCLPE